MKQSLTEIGMHRNAIWIPFTIIWLRQKKQKRGRKSKTKDQKGKGETIFLKNSGKLMNLLNFYVDVVPFCLQRMFLSGCM